MSAEKASYAFFDHTADAGVEVRAPTRAAVFETAATALFDLLVDSGTVGRTVDRTVSVAGADSEELLVRWLSELLFIHDAEGLLFSEFQITRLLPGRLTAVARGEPYDPSRHQLKGGIKAVTYHQVRVWQEAGGWMARVIFDV